MVCVHHMKIGVNLPWHKTVSENERMKINISFVSVTFSRDLRLASISECHFIFILSFANFAIYILVHLID